MAVGITGHRQIDPEHKHINVITATVENLFANLARALKTTVEREPAFFSQVEPILRIVCMAAEGADLICAKAARIAGSKVACILPFPFEEYQKDFSSPAAACTARSIIEAADAQFVLPGTRYEGPRSYERANELILANVDLVIAIWDGEPAAGRAGTAEVVQAAITRKIPVIVIKPSEPALVQLLVPPGDLELAWPIALDVPLRPLDTDLDDFVATMLSPPHAKSARQGFVDLIAEKTDYRSVRIEYPVLLKMFGVAADKSVTTTSLTHTTGTSLRRVISKIDNLANHYARLYRSSTVSEFLLTILAGFVAALTLIFFPLVAGLSIVGQLAINGLVLFDTMTRTRRRWQERWLDYRILAERLRCVNFLRPLGLGLREAPAPFRRSDVSWTEWFVRRHGRSLDPPSGTIVAKDLARFMEQLTESEIPGQLTYHRSTANHLGKLDLRLSIAARVALATAIATGVLFGISAYLDGGIDRVAWKPLAVVALFVLPAVATAFSAIRSDADLVRLVERSEMTANTLVKLQNAIRTTPPSYDSAAVAATRFADITGDELSEWRFVLESRRMRIGQRKASSS